MSSLMCESVEELRNKSLEKGREEEKEETVIRMLRTGRFSLEDDSIASGLSIEEVKRIQAKYSSAYKQA